MSKKILEDIVENIELIRKMYEDDVLTYPEIAEKLKISADVVRRFMKRNGIKIRKHSETIKLKNGIEANFEEIKRLFLQENLSTSTIAKMYKVDRQTIGNYLKQNDINPEEVSKTRKTALQEKNLKNLKKVTLSDEELIKLYCEDKLTASDIAKQFDASPRTVLIRLHELGVEVKQIKQLLEDEQYYEQHINRIKESMTDETYIKRAKTNIQRYGVDNPFKSVYFQNKAIATKCELDLIPTSYQQIYIQSIIGGELNFCVGNSALDIAFPEEKIYVEYDGGGHNLNVVLGRQTEKEFTRKEYNRTYYLLNKGWKQIRIISTKDKLPNSKKVYEMIKYAKEYLNNNRHYIIFDIDKGTVKTSQYENKYDFGRTKIIRRAS